MATRDRSVRLIGAPTRGCVVLATLGVTVMMLVATSVGSAKNSPSVRSQLEGLAQSPGGKKAERALTGAVPAVEMARAAEGLLARYGSEMTPFESSLLKVDELIGAAKNQAVLSAASSGRKLDSAQLAALRHLLGSVADNPAVKLVLQKARALQRSPKTLAAYLATDAAAPAPTAPPLTGNAALNSIDASLDSAVKTPSVIAFDAKLRKLMTGLAAARYLSALPPLAVASLIPAQTLESYDFSARRDARSAQRGNASIWNPSLPATTNADLLVGMTVSMGVIKDAAGDVVKGAALAAVGAAIAALLGVPVAAVLVGGYLVGSAISTAIETGEELSQYVAALYQSEHPIALKILPGTNVRMIAGVATTFAVESTTSDGKTLLGTVPATVSMVPNGGPCPAQVCTTTMAGPDAVTATMGDVTTSIPVTVLPGPLKFFGLAPTTVTIPLGADTNFAVFGTDAWDNPIDPDAVAATTTFSISPGSPDGWCVANTCGANAPGIYTVTATSGAFSQSATLTVTGPLDHLTLSPDPASIASGGSQTYTVEGYDAAGNDLGPDPNATLSIGPDGSCTGYTCTAATAGAHTITAIDGNATGATTLTVNASSSAYPVAFTATVNVPPLTGVGLYDNMGMNITFTGQQDPAANCATGYVCYQSSGDTSGLSGTLYGVWLAGGPGNPGDPCSISAQAIFDLSNSSDFGSSVALSQSNEDGGFWVSAVTEGDIHDAGCLAGLQVPLTTGANGGYMGGMPWVPGSQTSTWPLYSGLAPGSEGTVTVNWQY